MNWANRLTVARFFLTLMFVAALSIDFRFGHTTGLILFIFAGISDYVDGEIARRYLMITDFGKLMDPLVDKIMMAAAFICLIPFDAFPAWVVIVIISREFLITGLRLLALSKGKMLSAETMGKHKTAWQMVTILFFLILLSIREMHSLESSGTLLLWKNVWNFGGSILIAVTLCFTLYSGFSYLWKNSSLICNE